jgi:hypothetical protein
MRLERKGLVSMAVYTGDEVTTMKDAAQLAIDIQGASNLSGVVHSFSRVMTVLWAEANRQGKGTDWVNRHPIAVLLADKVRSLTGDDFASAWDECERLAGVE